MAFLLPRSVHNCLLQETVELLWLIDYKIRVVALALMCFTVFVKCDDRGSDGCHPRDNFKRCHANHAVLACSPVYQ